MESKVDTDSQAPTLNKDSEDRVHNDSNPKPGKLENDDPEKNNLAEPPEEAQDSAPAGPDPNEFPDGGFQAWFCIAGGFCTVFSSFGWVNCIGVFQDYYQANQLSSYSPKTVAWIPATESFMLFFFGLFSGKLTDSYAIAAAGTWFKKLRALAFGIMVSGSSMGGVVLPIMVQHLIEEVGFGWAMRITAFLIFGLLIFGNIAIKSRLPPVRKPFTLKEYFMPFAEIPFLLLAIGSLLVYIGAFLPFNFIIVQAKQAHMSTNLADYLVPIINAASIFGRIFPAHLGDVYGVFNVCIIFTLFTGVISLALWLPAASNAPIIVFAVLYGFASGLTLAIIPALVASISDIQKLGFRVGALYAFSSFGALFGSPVAGAIVTSQHGGYSGLKIFCGVTLIAGGVFIVFSRIKLVGPGLLVKK
ncbi:hypothetical protein IFR05_007210 [Cadophora sp. M221]|nr:hypothetical protein IFR05_007210 [Cadophora sp. M221]